MTTPTITSQGAIFVPRPKILAYYFPDWHHDSRNAEWFGPGWDEWALLKSARPRFDGHRQPRTPLQGHFDEATPANAASQIQLARDYGIDGFLIDFYWYDDGPYLNRALDEGLLAAENASDIEFALMWANHELVDIFPHSDPRRPDASRLKDGALDRSAFETMADHIVERYFAHHSYLKVDGRPWFTIYDIANFIDGLGGIENARDALRWLDERTRRAGFPGVHLNAILWQSEILPTSSVRRDVTDLAEELGFHSATSYVWVHHSDLDEHHFPSAAIQPLRDSAFAEYERYAADLSIPFYPNVTVGWDPSPRTNQEKSFARGRYPWTPVWDATPGEFRVGLEQARAFAERHPSSFPVITINAWNEWTEGSVLLPDTVNGYGFLEAVRDTFGHVEALG